MSELTSWSKDLNVEIAGRDVVNHAGSAALRLLADRSGLTAGLSGALARRGFCPVHDRGRVLADTAVLIADGGQVLRPGAHCGRGRRLEGLQGRAHLAARHGRNAGAIVALQH